MARNPGSKVRSIFVALSALLVLAGLVLTPSVVARAFAPDGEITEVVYVHVLRGMLVLCGLALLVAGLRAPVMWLARGLLAIVAVALTLGAAELAVRVPELLSRAEAADTARGIRPSAYTDLLWENTPSFVENGQLSFNSLGLRDDERTYDRSRDTIVVEGDSIESWRALPASELYPRRLETLLNADGASAPVQVLDFGVFGYSLHQKILMLEHRGLEWNPTRVIVGYCLNDPIPSSEFVAYFTHRPQPLVRLRLLSLVNEGVRQVMHGMGKDFHTDIHQPGSAEWAGVVADLDELGKLAREHHFQATLVIFPLLYDTTVAYPWADIHRRVGEAARAAGIQVVDLLDSYQREGIARVRVDTVHPNARGHEIAARQLYEAIRRHGVVQR